MRSQTVRWRVFPDAESLHAEAARFVLDMAREAIAARGVFSIVLAGGETPRAVYARLTAAATEWDRWQIYFGDERCLPLGDPQRNDSMARSVWLDRVPVPPATIHAIPAEFGPERAAQAYAATLATVGEFDLVLLGLGEDGHTASLFPDQPLGEADADPAVLPVRNAPKPPAERVSLTAARLRRARHVLFLVAGEGKRAAVSAWRQGKGIPASHITAPGSVDVFLDAAANGTDR